MTDLLRDAVWQFIGAALTAIGLVLAVLLALPQFRRKNLSCYITVTPVVNVDKNFRSALKLTFNGTAVDTVAVIAVRVWNSGQVPVIPTDFVEPLRLHFDPLVKILESSVAASEPSELAETIRLKVLDQCSPPDVPSVTLNPTLLNPGDFLDLAVLVTKHGMPRLSGRIVGVKSITIANPFQPRFGFCSGDLWRYIVAAMGVGIAASMLADLMRTLL